MNAQDIATLAIGYTFFCVSVFGFVMVTLYKHIRGQATLSEMPKWMLALIVFYSLCPLLNVVMLVKTIRLKPE
jgi:hypothetical protein